MFYVMSHYFKSCQSHLWTKTKEKKSCLLQQSNCKFKVKALVGWIQCLIQFGNYTAVSGDESIDYNTFTKDRSHHRMLWACREQSCYNLHVGPILSLYAVLWRWGWYWSYNFSNDSTQTRDGNTGGATLRDQFDTQIALVILEEHTEGSKLPQITTLQQMLPTCLNLKAYFYPCNISNAINQAKTGIIWEARAAFPSSNETWQIWASAISRGESWDTGNSIPD